MVNICFKLEYREENLNLIYLSGIEYRAYERSWGFRENSNNSSSFTWMESKYLNIDTFLGD